MPDLPDNQDEEQDKTAVSTPLGQRAVGLAPHSVVDGIYVIEREIGSGGAGSVYQVKQRLLEKTFALKVLHDTYSETTMQRFQNEAKIAAGLDHPNLVRAFHSGVLPDGKPFYVMDLISGMTLAEHLEKGPLRPPEVIDIFLPLCLALDYAHARGLVHRDIKPGNTVLTIEDGKIVPKIIDFGIAHLALSEGVKGAGLTRTGEIFGTPKYMSPEQCLSKKVDQRSDVYSLGCMMYECLTGKVPFMGENAVATSMLHVTAQPQALRDALPSRQFQRGWQEIIDQMLAKDPADRFQSCAQVAHALEAVRDNTVELPVKRRPSKPPEPPKPSGLKPSAIAMIAGVILLATAGGVALLKLNYNDDGGGKGKNMELDAHAPASKSDPGSINQYLASVSSPAESVSPTTMAPTSLPPAASVPAASFLNSSFPSTKKEILNPFAMMPGPKAAKPPDNALEVTAQKFPANERMFEKAQSFAEKGDWPKATLFGVKALKDLQKIGSPDDAAALSLRQAFTGLCLFNSLKGRAERSTLLGTSMYLDWAIKLNPYVGEYFTIRGRIYSAMKQDRAATQDFREAVNLAPMPTACGRVLRKFIDAKSEPNVGGSSSDAPAADYDSAKKLLVDGQYREAALAFRDLLRKGGAVDDKKRSLYLALVAYSFYRLSESSDSKSFLESAQTKIEEAIKVNPQPAEFYHIKSIILSRLDKPNEALTCNVIFERKNKQNPDPQVDDELRHLLYDSQPVK